MSKKGISCVILNYNDADTTLSLVKSIKDYKIFDYIIITDNCSTDNSYDRLKEIISNKIYVIRTEFNGGYGYGNNFGLNFSFKELNCRYSLIANPDVRFKESVVQALFDNMELNQSIAISAPLQYNSNGERIKTVAWRLPSAWQYILGSDYFLRNFIASTRYKVEELEKGINFVDCVPGSLLLVNLYIFNKVKGYDERNFLYCEETMIGKKVLDGGFYTILDTTQYYYHFHSVSISKSITKEKARMKLLLKSRQFVLKEYLNANAFQLLVASLLFRVVVFEVGIKEVLNSFWGSHFKNEE